jgi:hypothetical protein
VSHSCDFVLGYRLRVISLLGIAFVQFTIKNLCLLISTKSITLEFGYWNDRASFDELTIICLSVYLVASVRLAICGLNQKVKPSHSSVRLARLASVNLYLRWTPLCFKGVFFCRMCLLSPLQFKVALFFIRGVFLTATFFIEGLFNRVPCVLGMHHF